MPGILENRASGFDNQEHVKKTEEKKPGKKNTTGKAPPEEIDEDLYDETQEDQGKQRRKKYESRAVKEYTKKNKKEEKEALEEEPVERLTDEEIAELAAMEAALDYEKEAKHRKRLVRIKRINTAIMALLCVYLTVLIYGAAVTQFGYNDKGELAPIEMSAEEIAEKNEYLVVVGLYIESRNLYDSVLNLDYRIAKQVESPVSIAPEYQEAIDTVDKIAAQIRATRVGSKYTQYLQMLEAWVNSDMFNYCNYMSIALSQDNQQAEQEAIAVREILSNDFKMVTRNIITFGEDIKGYDLTELKDWSPDNVALRNDGIAE